MRRLRARPPTGRHSGKRLGVLNAATDHQGALTIESGHRAVFEARGQRVVFVRAPDNEPVRVRQWAPGQWPVVSP